jgi:hypothetical protein
VAQHGDRRAVGPVLIRRELAAHQRRNAEHAEEPGADALLPHERRRLADEDVHAAVAPREDGAIDARRAQDAAPFSEERMYALFEGAETAAALLERICGALDEHVGSGERFDDVTLLAVRRHGADEAPGRER